MKRLLQRAPGAVFVAFAMGALGFLPLFGGPGYEHALASGLVVPSAAAIASAWAVVCERTTSPLAAVGVGVRKALVLSAVSLATALLHAARVGVCEVRGAIVYFFLTAAAGSVVGGVWGAVAGEVASALVRRGRVVRPRRARALAVALAVAGPVLGVAVSLYRFVTSPMIFAFDPFVGYFSGTLYDTVIDAGQPLHTYRLGSLATVTAVALLASVLERRGDAPFGVVLDLRSGGTRARAALGLACALSSVGTLLSGAKLGHFSTTASIAADLGREKRGARCDVVYPSTTREQEAELLVKDCDEQVAAVEQALGARGPERLRAFFFRDEADKKRLMGAARVYIAKPWREEVYLQVGGYPHPVLGHEVAHVVAGTFGRGPFRIAAEAGGLVPNPGLIEGIAVFASPHDDDLTDAQWARAMMQLGILPPIERVFSLRFLGESSSKSYTLAGAFIGFVAERFGVDRVRAWYGGGDVETLVGRDWAALDAEFRGWLGTIALPAEAESFARAKFTRPGLFGRKCPHLVDALRGEADQCRDTQRYDEAIALYRQALAKDREDHASRQGLAFVERRHGDREAGRRSLEEIASSERTPRTYRDRAEETLADADFLDGAHERAAERYEALARGSLDEDAARTLEVKALGARDPAARASVQALLLGDAKRGPDVFVGGVELGRWESAEGAALTAYLVGRNLVQRGFYERGAAALDGAITATPPLPTPRLAREALRQRAVAACALGDRDALGRVRERIEGPADPFVAAAGGRRDATLRMIGRCLAALR